MKRQIRETKPADPPGGGFAALYVFLYGVVGAAAIFGTARQAAAGDWWQAGAWALYGLLLLWSVRHGQGVHERALSPYLVPEDPEPARLRPAPVTIKTWEVSGRNARPVAPHDSAVPADVWQRAAALAAAGDPIVREAVTNSGSIYRKWREELAALGYLESGSVSAAGLQWLAAMAPEFRPAAAGYRPVAVPSGLSSSSSSGSDRPDRTRPAANGRGQGWQQINAAPVAPDLDGALLLLVALVAAVAAGGAISRAPSADAEGVAWGLLIIGGIITAAALARFLNGGPIDVITAAELPPYGGLDAG